jgi:hypothetical protein
MSKDRDSADLIERASRNWLKAQMAGKAPSEWVLDLQLEWLGTGKIEQMSQFILKLCEKVDSEDEDTIGMIGADPMLALILWFPDQALPAIDEMADKQPLVIDALSTIVGGSSPHQAGIEDILTRHGRSVE